MRKPLEKTLRSQLERTVMTARETAEAAAREAFEQLGVKDSKSPDWLTPEQSSLRRALRARARALGGELMKDGTQKIAALVEEVAYEQWNRMIFARFLAENGLLAYEGVIVSIDDCVAIASELNRSSAWDVAADCAAKMLPNVFRTDSLSFKIAFAPDKIKALEALVEGLDPATFQASDALGWIYQHWQTKKKAAVNASEVKIGADELAPVTQLFTEPYMVAFLLDNSLGAWYAAPKLAGKTFKTEAEARAAVATVEIPLSYLRLVSDDQGHWRPASGSFEKWPKSLADFSMMDPCCGSGHFAVATLLMLVPMRMELEGLSAAEAVDAVLRENIHALELDRRCVEIAAFAVALEAWRYPKAGGYRKLPRLNIACDGIAPKVKKDEWIRLARRAARQQTGNEDMLIVEKNDESLWEANMVRSMGELWDVFQQAPVLGSLISPDLFKKDLFHADYETLADVLAENLDQTSDESREASIAAQGIIHALQLLGRKYDLIATNVPYLGRGQFDKELGEFCDRNYPDSQSDLATVFLERCLKFIEFTSGFISAVLPQNWMFLRSYANFRRKILCDHSMKFLAQLNEGAFESSAAAGGFAILFGLQRGHSSDDNERSFEGIDGTDGKTADHKKTLLLTQPLVRIVQAKCLKNPDARITLSISDVASYLSEYCKAYQGVKTGDDNRLKEFFWEGPSKNSLWRLSEGSLSAISRLGYSYRVFWNRSGECLARLQGVKAFSSRGIALTTVRNLIPFPHGENVFTSELSAVIVYDKENIPAIFAYLNDAEYTKEVRAVDQKIAVTNATLVKVPFELARWKKIASEKYPNGLPRPYADDPTQWIFHGHPCGSVVWDDDVKHLRIGADRVDFTVLHVAMARLLGYVWPSEQDNSIDLAPEMREVMKRNSSLEEFADKDGIVCIPALNGEESASSRLATLLAKSYGPEWSAAKLEQLLETVGAGGKTLEEWLRNSFFLQHAKLFGSRPFIWQIWDGLRDGFSALVNYHKFDRKTLETLIYSYLGDWISRQSNDVAAGVDGASEKLDRAKELKEKLEKILEGEAPFDIFVRWKALADLPYGWNPDLNDGVRVNIRPFCEAGVLREKALKFNIKWGKDKGKDTVSSPWYDVFNGDRINDYHTTLAEKAAAKKAKGID